jgi:beta-phosphoglucomutase-like phosphatase (HAD superfamily)
MSDLLTNERAVVADFDGTLVDTHHHRLSALRYALADHDTTIDDSWYADHCGLPIRDLLTQLAPSDGPGVLSLTPAAK